MVVNSYIYDSAGQRHVMGVLVRPGEDPKEKVTRFTMGFADSTRQRAENLLDCSLEGRQGCPNYEEPEKRRLTAQAQISSDQALVYGMVVEGPAGAVERISADTGFVAAVEIVGDNILLSPITPTGARGR